MRLDRLPVREAQRIGVLVAARTCLDDGHAAPLAGRAVRPGRCLV